MKFPNVSFNLHRNWFKKKKLIPRALVTYPKSHNQKIFNLYVQPKVIWLQSQYSFFPDNLSQQGVHSKALNNKINSFMKSNSSTHAKEFFMGLFSEDEYAPVVRHLYTVIRGTEYRVGKENLNPSSIIS